MISKLKKCFIIMTCLVFVSVKGWSDIIQFEVENLDCEPGQSGTFKVQMRHDWAPIGAQRLKELIDYSYYNGNYVFRVIPNFVAQFGLHGDTSVTSYWKNQYLPDDPVLQSNSYGTVTFATAGPNKRTTQIFVNLADNSYLDSQGFSPVGVVVQGMDVVEKICAKYGGDISQGAIMSQGNSFLQQNYPDLSYIKDASYSAGIF